MDILDVDPMTLFKMRERLNPPKRFSYAHGDHLNNDEKTMREKMESYKPKFLNWCKSFEQECQEMRALILSNPADVALLKKEYQELTGKRFKRGRYE
jgi:hypothetical protein